MIDIHSHLIHCVDDGSSCLDESIKIIKEALKSGVDKIIATPHYLEYAYIKNRKDNIERIDEIKEELCKQNINGIELYLGNEVYIITEIMDKIKSRSDNTFK